MDDLDHSVLIAEQDWDCFCTESEECSVQQAKLAALDESGFSDIDDDKTSVYVPSLPTQTSPDQHCEKDSVEEGKKQHQIGECKTEHTSENSEFTEYPSPTTEPQNSRSAEQMSDARESELESTYECQNKANEVSNLTEELNLKGNYEDLDNGVNKSSQDTTKPVSETSSADIKHEESTDGLEMLTEETDTAPVAKKEKERWFVTVNDSPNRLIVKDSTSVPKKRRKKKTSKNLSQNIGVMEKCSSLNNNTELDKEITDRQTMQDKSEQENVFSDSPDVLHIQDIICISPIGSCESEGEKANCAISLKKESMTEISEAKLEINPADSLNSLSTPKHMPEKIFTDLSGPLLQYWDHESTACDKCDKSTVDCNCECRHTTDNINHFNNNIGVENPIFIMGALNPTSPSDTERERTEEQEPLGQSYNREEESSQETQSSSKTSGPTRPIFAISSFWEEMEKLTINDILQLKTANNRSLLTESIDPEEISHVDTVDTPLLDRGELESKVDSLEDGLADDAADSDYFTHLDDTKPDRSSCEFSTYSDFDEEFLQLLHVSASPSPEPLEGKEQTQSFLDPTCPMELEATRQSDSNEIVKLCTESYSPLYSETEAEMQDIFTTTNEENNMSTFLLDHCSMRRPTPSPVLSISDFLDDQSSFFEILKSDTESDQYQVWIPDSNTSLCFSQTVSVAETYDEFFSDFEVGNFLFPSVQGSVKSEKTLVPIYSSSRSVVKDLEFPEVDKVKQLDSEDEIAPIRVMRCASPSETLNMCFITSQRSTWRNLSLRHTKLLMGRTWCRMATSRGFPKTVDTAYSYGTRTSSNSSLVQPKLPVVLENQALRQLTEHQIHVGATVADADRGSFLFSFKQADMCLVCIAFASWVLKSSDPQSTDMWKAALLANVSAISAIQYLRRCIKEG